MGLSNPVLCFQEWPHMDVYRWTAQGNIQDISLITFSQTPGIFSSGDFLNLVWLVFLIIPSGSILQILVKYLSPFPQDMQISCSHSTQWWGIPQTNSPPAWTIEFSCLFCSWLQLPLINGADFLSRRRQQAANPNYFFYASHNFVQLLRLSEPLPLVVYHNLFEIKRLEHDIQGVAKSQISTMEPLCIFFLYSFPNNS